MTAAPSIASAKAFAAGNRTGHAARETDDFYPTPPCATEALLAVEKFEGPIWEPACGTGDMSRVLEAAGHRVISTDLVDRGYGEGGRDFLCEWQPIAPNIVTNPPFRSATEFVDRALQLTHPPDRHTPGAWIPKGGVTRKVALFLRLAFLEGQARGRWFPATPLARVWIMSRRVPIGKGRLLAADETSGPLAFAWFVWDQYHAGHPELRFLDWKHPERSA
ncbi:MAG TPA: hypothetical protein VF628_11280 [Allosphingosinicella sp.]|jgi:hypothetical protein